MSLESITTRMRKGEAFCKKCYIDGGRLSGGVYNADESHWDFISDVMKVQATKSKTSATTSTNANLITLERAHGVRISSKDSSHLITKTNGVKKISHRILLTFLWFNNWVYPQTWAFHKILLLSSGSNMKITTTSNSIFSLSLTSTFPKISSNWQIKVINSLSSYLQQILGSTSL